MRQLFSGVRGTVDKFRASSRQRGFVDAVMAACALVALADKDHRLSEVVARDRVLHALGREQGIDVRRAVATYDRYHGLLLSDPPAGRRSLMDIVAGLKGDRPQSELLIKVCLAIGNADQEFSARERAVVEEICNLLGLHPGDVGVYDL